MDFVPAAEVDVPASAAEWIALEDGDRDTLHAAWGPQLLIDITAWV